MVKVGIQLTVKNFGNAPALHVGVNAGIVGGPLGAKDYFRNFRSAGDTACAMAETASKEKTGMYIFPAERRIFSFAEGATNIFTPFDMNDALREVGCITYIDQFTKALHHTRFCFKTETQVTKVETGQLFIACGINEDAD